jgi:hypothetical protein
MTMPASSERFPAPRVTPDATHAFGGIWRLTARRFFTPGYWLTLAGLLVVLVQIEESPVIFRVPVV